MQRTITGRVSTSGSAIYVVPIDRNAEVTSMLFNSPIDYEIKIYRQIRLNNQRSLIYKLDLNAGDVITDRSSYALNPGDSLYAVSSSDQTNFTIILSEQ
jgi:hypothetical protein